MIFDMRNGYKMRVINSPSICNTIDINEEGTILASGHQSGDVCLWDLRNGKLILRQKVHEAGAVTSTSFSLAGTQIVTASRDNTLKVLDARNLGILGTARSGRYRAAYNWTRSSFSPDCHYAASGSADGTVYVWELATPITDVNEEVKALSHNHSPVSCVAWSPTGMQLASSHRDGTLMLWGP